MKEISKRLRSKYSPLKQKTQQITPICKQAQQQQQPQQLENVPRPTPPQAIIRGNQRRGDSCTRESKQALELFGYP